MNLKNIAQTFLTLSTSGQVEEAFSAYVHPNFIHHNPWFPGDRESLKQGMIESAERFPQKVFEILYTIEENNKVVVHGRIKLMPQHHWIALVHIFRFENGLIIEEWEATQQEEEDSPNQNGLF